MPRRPFLPALLALALAPSAAAQAVPSPEEHLGRPVGTDFQLADWDQVRSWYELLGAGNPRARVERIGRSTEGRPFLLCTIASEENLARLARIQDWTRALADPRGRSEEELREAVEECPLVVFVSCSMHSTETAATEMGMQLSWLLATSEEEPWTSARRELVVNVIPTVNPDGLDHVVHWYRQHVGSPYEATGLTKLYQLYAGHDNNRDWFMLNLEETRLVSEQLYTVWHPQVYWDVHQQGSGRERLFVPPFRDPLNPNLDPRIIGAIDVLGSRALFDLTREGYRGVSTGVTYDMWWNGGNRNVPVRHNIVGLLTEAASVDIATPIFLPPDRLSAPRGLPAYVPSHRFPDPWPGGWWRLRDIIEYELAFARSLFASLASERALWMGNALAAARHAIELGARDTPRAWILPADARDASAARRLAQTLLRSGVELHRAPAPVAADGREWPAGSIVVRRDQPYGQHVKDLFEVQRYPAGDPPYDVAGWTLPYLMGVHRVEVVEPLELELERVTNANDAIAAFAGDPRLGPMLGGWLSTRDSDAWTALARGLRGGAAHTFVTQGGRAGLVAPGEGATLPDEQGLVLRTAPRIGLYSPWSGDMDEGWMRWVLTSSGIPFTTVRNEMLRAGRLSDLLDVLVLPGVSGNSLDRGRAAGSAPPEFTGGLDPEGAVAVEEFVRGGGTLVACDRSTDWAIELLRLPLADVTSEEGFSCPGSVLRAVPEPHALTADLPDSVALFFSRSSAFRVLDEDEREEQKAADSEIEVLLRYAPTRVLLSGWIAEPETIEGQAAWVLASHGEGRVHLFGFRPQYRGWAQGTFHLLFRALFLTGGLER